MQRPNKLRFHHCDYERSRRKEKKKLSRLVSYETIGYNYASDCKTVNDQWTLSLRQIYSFPCGSSFSSEWIWNSIREHKIDFVFLLAEDISQRICPKALCQLRQRQSSLKTGSHFALVSKTWKQFARANRTTRNFRRAKMWKINSNWPNWWRVYSNAQNKVIPSCCLSCTESTCNTANQFE